jgi:hypothetical protein
MDSTRAVVRELTPDPVHADRRPAGAVGRQARLELVFGVRRGRTHLTHAYAEPPFRVGHVFGDGDAVWVILVCAAPACSAAISCTRPSSSKRARGLR